MLQNCTHINKEYLPVAQEILTPNIHSSTSYMAFFLGRFHRAQSDVEWRVVKDILVTLLFTGTPKLLDLTEFVKSDVYFLHISSPYFIMVWGFVNEPRKRRGERRISNIVKNLRAWVQTVDVGEYLFTVEGSELTHWSKALRYLNVRQIPNNLECGQVQAKSSLGIFNFNLFQKMSL